MLYTVCVGSARTPTHVGYAVHIHMGSIYPLLRTVPHVICSPHGRTPRLPLSMCQAYLPKSIGLSGALRFWAAE